MAGPRPDDAYNSVQDVAPTVGMPNDYLTVQAKPSQFGAQVGEALQGAGKQGSQASEETFQTNMKFLQLRNDMAATTGATQYANYVSDKDSEFRQLQGQNQLAAWPAYHQDLNDQLHKMADQMPSLIAKQQFLKDAQSFYDRSVYNLGNEVANTANKSMIESFDGKQKAIENQAAAYANDPKALQDGIDATIVNQLYKAQHLGLQVDPKTGRSPAADAMVQEETGKLGQAVIINQLNTGGTLDQQVAGLKTAQETYTRIKDETIPGTKIPVFDADHRDKIESALNYRAWVMAGRTNKESVDNAVVSAMSQFNSNYQADVYGSVGGNTPYLKNPNDGHYNVAQYVNDFNTKHPTTLEGVKSALIGTERSGPNAVSSKGALGIEQLTLPTFESEAKLMGKEGQLDFNNAADRKTVFDHLVPRLWEKFNHDPEKVATAYFSGEDNVNVNYKKGQAPYGDPSVVNPAQWAETHQEQFIQNQVDQYKKDNPDAPASAILDLETKLHTKITRNITMNKQKENVDASNIWGYLMGNNPTKLPITDPLVLENDPNINQIWSNFSQDHPKEAWDIRNKLIVANAHGQSTGYGTQFWQNLSGVANGQVPNSLQLIHEMGWNKDAIITNSGANALSPMLARQQTDDGRQFNQEEFKFLSSLRHFITGTDSRPGVKDPINDENWNKFLQVTLPKIEAGLQKGLTAHEMFDDPKSKTYVGDALDKFKPDTNKMIQHMVKTALTPGQVLGAGGPKDFTNQAAFDSAIQTNSITKDQAKTIWDKHPEWHNK